MADSGKGRWENFREVVTDTYEELCETALIEGDLASAVAAITLWSKMSSASSSHSASDTRTIADSLFRDGVVQFVACFEKTAHPLVVGEVYGGLNGAADYFKWLKDLRNSYAAHRFGAARQSTVGVVVEPSGYQGFQPLELRYTGPAQSDHEQLIAFFSAALKFAESKLETLLARYDCELRSIPLEILLKAPPLRVRALDQMSMAKTSRGNLRRDLQRRK